LIYLAGQVAEDPKADITAQTQSVLAQIDRLLLEAGTDKTKILSAPEMRERLAAQGAEASPDSPAEFAKFISAELVKYARIVKASGAKVD
jgi:hypothetical protein